MHSETNGNMGEMKRQNQLQCYTNDLKLISSISVFLFKSNQVCNRFDKIWQNIEVVKTVIVPLTWMQSNSLWIIDIENGDNIGAINVCH